MKGCFFLGAIAGSMIGVMAGACMMPYIRPVVKRTMRKCRHIMHGRMLRVL